VPAYSLGLRQKSDAIYGLTDFIRIKSSLTNMCTKGIASRGTALQSGQVFLRPRCFQHPSGSATAIRPPYTTILLQVVAHNCCVSHRVR
jgi:hypothetical protein